VIALSVLFSTFVILYGHGGQESVALTVEEAEISQLILRAKDLSVTTYTDSAGGCADGVQINPASGTYSLFIYQPNAAGTCPSLASTSDAADFKKLAKLVQYDSQSWNVHNAQGIVMASGTDQLEDILFYPPAPATLISQNNKTFLNNPPTSYIYLQAQVGGASATIAVNPTGQVSTQ